MHVVVFFTLVFFSVVILAPEQNTVVRQIATMLVMACNSFFLAKNANDVFVQISAVTASLLGMYTSLLPII
jgi:hypothetical protein